jgi:hypothetical protein
MTPALHALAQLLASRMVDSLAWGTVVVLFAAMVLRVTRQNAGTRFAVWFAALLAIGLVPWIAGGRRPSEVIPISPAGRAAITLPDQWALYLCGAWAVFAGWFAVGIGRAVRYLRVLRRGCNEVDPAAVDPMLRETIERHGANRRVAVCTSDEIDVPMALGLLKPAIVLPGWVMSELPVSEVNQILLHELAHLRRWDDWTNFIQQAVKAVFFFHPAVWWIERKVALEREMACDDAVLAEIASPRAYAECLAHLAEKSFLQKGLALAQAALGTVRHTSLRVAEILSVKRDGARSRSWKPAVSVVAGFAVACGVWSARVPKLIGFSDHATAHGPRNAIAPNVAKIQSVDAGITQPVPVVAARFISNVQPHRPVLKTRPAVARRPRSKAKVANVVHSIAAVPSVVPFTETVFFVIEGRDGAAPDVRLYQIRMLHVAIQHPSPRPASNTPQKQI